MRFPRIGDLGNLETRVSTWTSSVVGNDAYQGAKPVKMRIAYFPPPVEAVEACVRKICRELGQHADEKRRYDVPPGTSE